MDETKLKTLDDFLEESDEFEKRFERLGDNAANDSQRLNSLVVDLTAWLHVCVEHGRFLSPGCPERRALRSLIEQWSSRLRQYGKSLEGIDRLAEFDPRAGVVLPHSRFPYQGLAAFTEEDDENFFGREELIREYVGHLNRYPTLLIQSESGGGKSSVAMAGVLPKLKRQHPEWLFTERLTPGTKPVEVLRDALTKKLDLSDGADRFDGERVRDALGGRTLLLFIDQLEELLTLCSEETEQAGFSQTLAELVKFGNVRMLATLRSDHYDRLANSQVCRPLFLALSAEAGVQTLPPMKFEQIRRAILVPAEKVGLRFIPLSLVDQLANETANSAGGLPLLQFALQRLWELRPTNEVGAPLDLIGEEAFKKLPSVREALGAMAEAYFTELSERMQKACERLMLELTVLDERLEVPLRRRRLEKELIDVLVRGNFATPPEALEMIEGFVDRRLLVRTGEGQALQIEVAHEVLFRHWDHFQAWINSEANRMRLQQVRQITQDAHQWEQQSRSRDYLRLKGDPLKKALEYRAENWLDELSAYYVKACDALQAQEINHTEALQQEAAEQQQEARVARRWLSVSVWGIVTIAAVVFLLWRQYDQDLQRKREAAFNALASLVPQLHPLEALDLAFTLEKRYRGRFVSPLAHAIDRLHDSRVVGVREQGADFTHSGEAIFQFDRQPDQKLLVKIFPIDTDGVEWGNPAEIDVEENGENGRLAWLDVGPPVKRMPDKRLVIMSFFDPLTQQFKRLVAYWIGRTSKPEFIDSYPYVPDTRIVSQPSFDATGERTAVAAVQLSSAPPKGEVIVVEKNADGKLYVNSSGFSRSAKTPNPRNGSVITAVAFPHDGSPYEYDGSKPQLITGRLDGSIFCGEKRIERQDPTPITSMRAAGTGPSYVALHQSNRLVVGNCGRPTANRLDEMLTSPQSLSLRERSTEGDLHLSFTDNLRLCNWSGKVAEFSGRHLLSDCWAADLKVDQAIPILDENRNSLGDYLALPDREKAWFVRLHVGLHVDHGESETAKGTPVAWKPDANGKGTDASSLMHGFPAASPNEAHVLRITSTGLVREHGGALAQLKDPEKQIAASVNDQGFVAVLYSDQKLTTVDIEGNQKDAPLGFQGTCLKMSASGKKVLVAGAKAESKIIDVNTNKSPNDTASDKKPEGRRGAKLASCAIGDDGTQVFVFKDGQVEYRAPEGDLLKPVSELVAFRLPGAALDTSIDASSRFVAVLGEKVKEICPAGVEGYPLRIWDIKQARPDFPVASACLPHQKLLGIGPVAETDERWLLPVYENNGNLRRFHYHCLACGGTAQIDETAQIDKWTQKFQPKELTDTNIRSFYGFEP